MSEVGRILKSRRESLGLEIRDIAQRTCIRTYYLKALEEGRFHVVPKFFDISYLKIYAKLLGIDTNLLLAMYDGEKNRTG